MAEILTKNCKLEDLKKFRYGFTALKYKRAEYQFEYKRDFIGDQFYVQTIYNSKKNCTYVVLDDIGFLAMFGPSGSDDVIVLKVPGDISKDDLYDLWNEPVYKAAIEELYMKYHENLKKEDES